MNALDVLSNEHRVIKRVLECLGAVTSQARMGGNLEGGSFRELCDFLQQFVDRCHHRKEEARLFPLLRQRGVGCQPAPLDTLLDEHEQGRTHVRAMAQNLLAAERGDDAARSRLCEHAERYRLLLAEHIHKEDDCLFPQANKVLTASEHQALLAAFDDIEQHELGPGVHARLHALADDLCARWRVPGSVGDSHPGTCECA
jgi:hemerythrin-like domain-containing protein